MPKLTWPAKKSITFWVVSEPTPTNWTAGSADAGAAAANAAPAKPSATAPATARLFSLDAWPSHPDFLVRATGGLGYMESLPLVEGVRLSLRPGACPPFRPGRAGCFPLTGISLPAKLLGVGGG